MPTPGQYVKSDLEQLGSKLGKSVNLCTDSKVSAFNVLYHIKPSPAIVAHFYLGVVHGYADQHNSSQLFQYSIP